MTNARFSSVAAFARISALAAFCCLLTQCASLKREIDISGEDLVTVELTQPPKRTERIRNPQLLVQRILSESVVNRSNFYNSRKTDQLTKVVTKDQMQLLLDAFATGGFFENAGERALFSDATTLHVKVNDRTYVWQRAIGAWAAELGDNEPALRRRAQQFTLCQTSFLDLYNATKAYRTGTGSDSVIRMHEEQIQGRGGLR